MYGRHFASLTSEVSYLAGTEVGSSSSSEPYLMCDSTRLTSATAGTEAEHEERERELRFPVPALLEAMNHAASEVNSFERQTEETQVRLEQLKATVSSLNAEHRVYRLSATIDKARPYYDATHALTGIGLRVEVAASNLSAASSLYAKAKQKEQGCPRTSVVSQCVLEQKCRFLMCCAKIESDLYADAAHIDQINFSEGVGISNVRADVLRCQQELYQSSQEYNQVLWEYQDARVQSATQRAIVGESAIRRAQPYFEHLMRQQQEVERLQRVLGECRERVRTWKSSYATSLYGLEEINVEIHKARQDFLDRKSVLASTCMDQVGGANGKSFLNGSAVEPHFAETPISQSQGPPDIGKITFPGLVWSVNRKLVIQFLVCELSTDWNLEAFKHMRMFVLARKRPTPKLLQWSLAFWRWRWRASSPYHRALDVIRFLSFAQSVAST